METNLIDNLFEDVTNKDSSAVYPAEAVCGTEMVMMKRDRENQTTADSLVGNKNDMDLNELSCIEHKTRCVSMTKEIEFKELGDSKHIKLSMMILNLQKSYGKEEGPAMLAFLICIRI